MALMNCPECSREISDTIKQCPHCGYSLKKSVQKKGLLIAAAVLAVCLMVAIAVYTLVIRQNLLIQQAEEAFKAGNYELAAERINMVSPNAVDADLLYDINMRQAVELLKQGRYFEADALYSKLPQTEEIKAIREKLFYETRILACVSILEDTLDDPESLVLEEAVLLSGSTTLDESRSTDEQAYYMIGEPTCILHYRARNYHGYMTNGFVRFKWNGSEYDMGVKVSTLTMSGSLSQQENAEIGSIKIALAGTWIGEYDINRMNTVIRGGYADKTQLLDYNEVVPEPTPRIVQLIP